MSNLPGNPYARRADQADCTGDAYAISQAVLALAWEQRQRNRLAAATAQHRGILPDHLTYLLEEATA